MQRKNIDQSEFADLYASMNDAKVEVEEVITTINGKHTVFGGLILISAMDDCVVLGNDLQSIFGRDETVETDLAISEPA